MTGCRGQLHIRVGVLGAEVLMLVRATMPLHVFFSDVSEVKLMNKSEKCVRVEWAGYRSLSREGDKHETQLGECELHCLVDMFPLRKGV